MYFVVCQSLQKYFVFIISVLKKCFEFFFSGFWKNILYFESNIFLKAKLQKLPASSNHPPPSHLFSDLSPCIKSYCLFLSKKVDNWGKFAEIKKIGVEVLGCDAYLYCMTNSTDKLISSQQPRKSKQPRCTWKL